MSTTTIGRTGVVTRRVREPASWGACGAAVTCSRRPGGTVHRHDPCSDPRTAAGGRATRGGRKSAGLHGSRGPKQGRGSLRLGRQAQGGERPAWGRPTGQRLAWAVPRVLESPQGSEGSKKGDVTGLASQCWWPQRGWMGTRSWAGRSRALCGGTAEALGRGRARHGGWKRGEGCGVCRAPRGGV